MSEAITGAYPLSEPPRWSFFHKRLFLLTDTLVRVGPL